MSPRPWALVRSLAPVLGAGVLCHWAAEERALQILRRWDALALGAGLSILSFACYAARFRATMRTIGLDLGFRQAFRLSARALFHHFFVPLSVGNDLSRFLLCRAAGPALPGPAIAGGIVFDHALGTLALGLLAAASMGVFAHVPWLLWLTPATLASLALALAVDASWRVDAAARRRRWYARLALHRAAIAEALLYSLLMYVLLAAAVHLGAQAGSIAVDYHQILAVLVCGALLQVIPLNAGGLHLGDLAATGLYPALGVPLNHAILLVSLAYSCRLAVALLGGVLDALPAEMSAPFPANCTGAPTRGRSGGAAAVAESPCAATGASTSSAAHRGFCSRS